MAVINFNITENLKRAWQTQCRARGVSMAELLCTWIENDLTADGGTVLVDENLVSRECKCLICGYSWTPRKGNPAACVACKSYGWNNAEASSKRRDRQTAREQKLLYAEFEAQYKRIGRLTHCGMAPEIAARVGTTPEKLIQYLKGEKPVTAAQIAHLRGIL